jgi:hypothetical protein
MARRELRRGRMGDHSLGHPGVVNDALAIYFLDATIAGAFVARWCAAQKVEVWMGCIGSATMNRHRGSERLCIGHPERVRTFFEEP